MRLHQPDLQNFVGHAWIRHSLETIETICKLDHLSTRTTICPHAIEGGYAKIHEIQKLNKRRWSKAKPEA
jgi:hypothetical protein